MNRKLHAKCQNENVAGRVCVGVLPRICMAGWVVGCLVRAGMADGCDGWVMVWGRSQVNWKWKRNRTLKSLPK